MDWSEPALNVLLSKATLGEVRREGAAFAAELRSLAHRLAEESGRLYTATCSADLGDARCTVDLTIRLSTAAAPSRRSRRRRSFTCHGLDAFDDGWFTAGAHLHLRRQ